MRQTRFFTFSLLFLLLSCDLVGAQTRRRTMRYGDAEAFLISLPVRLQNLQTQHKNWQQAIEDGRDEDRIGKMRDSFAGTLFYQTGFFANAAPELAGELTGFRESLEYFDAHSQALLRWYLHVLQDSLWLELHTGLNDEQRAQYFNNASPDSVLSLRAQQLAFFPRLRQAIAQIPAKYRRNWMDRFKAYDQPPEPKGGFAALQKAFSERLAKMTVEVEGVVLVKAFIAEDGEVLRVTVDEASGVAAIDSIAVAVIRQTGWQPALYKGKPFKTDVIVPLRIWLKE